VASNCGVCSVLNCLHTAIRSLPVALLAVLAVMGARAEAGERLTLGELVARSEAIALVKVDFGSKHAPDRVAVEAWILPPRGSTTLAAPDAAGIHWFGLCLPSSKILDGWLQQHPRFESQAVWQAARKAGGFRTVVFLRPDRRGQFTPTCETEAMLSEGWSHHPRHATWRERLAETIRARSERPAK